MKPISITTPFTKETIETLHAGSIVSLSGVIYTGRDAAHKRMIELLASGKPLPFDIAGQAVYYAGPCPAPPGRAIALSVRPQACVWMYIHPV